MAQALFPCSFYGDGPPLSLADIIASTSKMPAVFAHGHSTQVKKPNYYHHVSEATTGKNCAFFYGYDDGKQA